MPRDLATRPCCHRRRSQRTSRWRRGRSTCVAMTRRLGLESFDGDGRYCCWWCYKARTCWHPSLTHYDAATAQRYVRYTAIGLAFTTCFLYSHLQSLYRPIGLISDSHFASDKNTHSNTTCTFFYRHNSVGVTTRQCVLFSVQPLDCSSHSAAAAAADHCLPPIMPWLLRRLPVQKRLKRRMSRARSTDSSYCMATDRSPAKRISYCAYCCVTACLPNHTLHYFDSFDYKFGWWPGVAVKRFDRSTKLLSPGRICTWKGECLLAGKPFQYVTSRPGQLSLPSLREVNRVPLYLAGIKAGRVHLCPVAGNTVWSHTAGDAP